MKHYVLSTGKSVHCSFIHLAHHQKRTQHGNNTDEKKKKPPKHVHLLIRTGSFHESFAAKHKTWGLQFLLVVSNKQNDLPIIC
jgi:hypothetical protein